MSPALLAAAGVVATMLGARAAVGATRIGPALRRGTSAPLRAPSSSFTPWLPGRVERARRRLVRELPDALEDIARSLRSGMSLRVALAEAAGSASTTSSGARGELAGVVSQVERGEPLGAALESWARRRPFPEVRLTVAALALGLDAGATSPRTVDSLAATVRERLAVAGEVTAQATQARLSALVITVLPLAFTTWTCLTDRRIASFLFATPAGWACLSGGIALNALGGLWMRRITRSIS